MAKETRWLNILERSEDQDLGLGIVRLARLAEAVHGFEMAKSVSRIDGCWVQGRDPWVVVPAGRDDVAVVHKEVNQ